MSGFFVKNARPIGPNPLFIPWAAKSSAKGFSRSKSPCREGLHHPKAERQFAADLDALRWADTCVLVLPCGRSAHTEAGWMAGAGRRVLVYIPEMQEPELMYKLFDGVASTIDDLLAQLA